MHSIAHLVVRHFQCRDIKIQLIVFLIDEKQLLHLFLVYKEDIYLAPLAGVDPVVEPRGLVTAHTAQHAVIPIKF